MTGLKSGSGDDLWGDEEAEGDAESAEFQRERAPDDDAESTDDAAAAEADASRSSDPAEGESASDARPYIVRRAIRDKSVQFERDERLTFFVHDDVVDGERDLLTRLESALGRDVPKFDVREAVYRAALRNPDDVLDELLDMGYALDEDPEQGTERAP